MGIYEIIQESFTGLTIKQLAINSFFALGIIIIGVLLGKIIDLALRKLSEKIDLNKHVKASFTELALLIIRWSVYIIFINLGLNQLGIPVISNFFSSILITIPAFTGALLLLVIGFGLAYYLKKIIKNSETTGGEFISQLVFYFVIFVFGAYSVKTALISIYPATTSSVIILVTAISAAGAVYYHVQKELKKSS